MCSINQPVSVRLKIVTCTKHIQYPIWYLISISFTILREMPGCQKGQYYVALICYTVCREFFISEGESSIFFSYM